MIPWYWTIITAWIGAIVGILTLGMCLAAKDKE